MSAEAAIADLHRRFGLPGIVKVVEGNGGMAKVQITTADAMGEMYLHGAHVTSWKPRGADEVLFVSSQSRWEDGRAIRGGIPVCFPWFADRSGDPKAPAHGFVRTKAWQLDSIVTSGNAVTVAMVTQSDETTRRWWPADFRLENRVTFGSELSQELVLENTGATPLRFEEALHAYFQIAIIEKVRIQGLDSVPYLDKPDRNRQKTQHGPIVVDAETDRVYLNTSQAIDLEDLAWPRRIRIAKENSLTTVVWNPWVEKARALADLEDAEWRNMICVETSNVSDFAVELAPGRRHTMKATIHLADF